MNDERSTHYPVGRRVKSTSLIAAAILLILIVWAIQRVVVNPNLDWDIFGKYLFADGIMSGLWLTCQLTVVAMIFGIALGTIVALMQLSTNPIIKTPAWAFVWFIRSVPPLVHLIFWYNMAAMFPKLSLGIPFGPSTAEIPTNSIITAWTAGILALGLHEAAYMAEIIRAGIGAIDKGQSEAAVSIGMTPGSVMSRVVLPQALRIIIPPTGNQIIGMVKLTSLVSVIALKDLLFSAQVIYSRTFEVIELLLVVTFWYTVVTSILMVGQAALEKKLAPTNKRIAIAVTEEDKQLIDELP